MVIPSPVHVVQVLKHGIILQSVALFPGMNLFYYSFCGIQHFE